MGYARPRSDSGANWDNMELRNLEGTPLGWVPRTEWVHSYFFCIDTGLYVLSDDEDVAFVAHSIDLEFVEELPNGQG